MPDRIPPALADHLGPLLGRAHEAHRRLSLAALAPLELTPKGFGALRVLDAEGPMSQRRLAERQGIDRTTAVAVVDELERLRAVERRRDPTDGAPTPSTSRPAASACSPAAGARSRTPRRPSWPRSPRLSRSASSRRCAR